jgi:hypothetical protein
MPERTARGEQNGKAKLTAEAVQEIRTRHRSGETVTDIAARFEVARTTVRQVILRQTWRHVDCNSGETARAQRESGEVREEVRGKAFGAALRKELEERAIGTREGQA